MAYGLLTGTVTFLNGPIEKWKPSVASQTFDTLDEAQSFLKANDFTKDTDGVWYRAHYTEKRGFPTHTKNILKKVVTV